MNYFKDKTFILENYQKEKPFSSFLSGIAGKMGKPIWSFLVNRGQLIASFGIRDKNGAIMEFYPANLSYIYTPIMGFRTFIKIDGITKELFLETNENQKLLIDSHQVAIIERNEKLGIEIKVTYFGLPNSNIAALVRKVEIENIGEKNREIKIVDGMAQILTSGVDYGGYKAVSNLLQSWMVSHLKKDHLFFKLSSSTEDTEEVLEINEGNFYFSKQLGFKKLKYIYDYKAIFHNDSSFKTPYGLLDDSISSYEQANINQVPSAMTLFEGILNDKISFISVIGYADDEEVLNQAVNELSFDVLEEKSIENYNNHKEILDDITIETNFDVFDNYLKQSYLDNLMRGGRPLVIDTKEGKAVYHLYSRKHGDLERDYNFFSTEPSYYSQGNGNFRDVLQNRRNDILFFPEIEDFNIYQFGSLIQADGYNPLSIEGVLFKFVGSMDDFPEVRNILKDNFTLGILVEELQKTNNLNKLDAIIKNSKIIINAEFGEGFWQDHFTYFYDLLETYLAVYPDKYRDLLFKNIKYPFFNSPVLIRKRNEKYVLNKSGEVRQYHAIKYRDYQVTKWLENKNGDILKVNLMGKLLTLIVNKFALLDQEGIGIMYEAGKPGWNDAMNGIPGLFGSGVGEMIELSKLVDFVHNYATLDEDVYLLKSTNDLLNSITKDFDWDYRITTLENYRDKLEGDQEVVKVNMKDFSKTINYFKEKLTIALDKAKEISSIYPTYLTYEAIDYKKTGVIGDHGMELVEVLSFKIKPITEFLEAPARVLATNIHKKEAKEIYETVKNSELYDTKFKFYKTSKPLDNESDEIGRIKGFSPGWLERESNFLHMTYKYLLGLIKSGLYDEFYDESVTNLTSFMNPKVYGRNPLENSSFIVPSNGLDKTKHGQGFFARLSGSNAEFLSIWRYLFLGKKIFTFESNKLTFTLDPKLHYSYFKSDKVSTTLFRNTKITYINNGLINTYSDHAVISKMEVFIDGKSKLIIGNKIVGDLAHKIRDGLVQNIIVYIDKK